MVSESRMAQMQGAGAATTETYALVRRREEPAGNAADGPSSARSQLDLNVYAAGELELHQRVHGLRRGVEDVEQPLVRAHLELLA